MTLDEPTPTGPKSDLNGLIGASKNLHTDDAEYSHPVRTPLNEGAEARTERRALTAALPAERAR